MCCITMSWSRSVSSCTNLVLSTSWHNLTLQVQYLALLHVLLPVHNQLVAVSVEAGQDVWVQYQADQGPEQVEEVGDEEEERLKDIQEPPVPVAQVVGADGQEVSETANYKILPNIIFVGSLVQKEAPKSIHFHLRCSK